MANTKISALTAATAGADADEFAINEAGTSKKITLAQIKTHPFPAGSASAGTWPKLTAGTLLTTPEVGALELDANAFYMTTDAGNRGVVPVRQIIRADATRTFTSNTSAQNIFTNPTNGRLTLETGTYLMTALLAFTSMSATSGNLRFDMLGGGSATLADILMHTFGQDVAANAAPSAVGGQWTATKINTTNAVTAATGTGLILHVNATFEVSVAGTIQPQITLTTANAAVLSIGSYLMVERIGSTSLVSVGQWD